MVPTLSVSPRSLLSWLAVSLALGLSGCGSKEPAAPAAAAGPRPAGAPAGGAGGGGGRRGGGGAAPVLVGQAQRKVVPLTLDAIGAVEPSRTATVRSQVTGTLLKIHFTEGQEVKPGDLLFEVDARPFENALKSAQADLEKVRVQLETARNQVTRYRALTEGAMISKEQFQTIQDNERVLATQLLASEAAVNNAKLQLDYCFIRAPLSGRTGALGAYEGDLVRSGDATTALVIIHQLNPISVTFGVPQQYLGSLARYREAGTLVVKATPPGADEAPESGELSFVDNSVDSSSGTIKLKASFANTARRLWPGQFANVSVLLASPEVLVVPAAAVENDQAGQHVYVVKPDNTAEFRKVVVERTAMEEAVIGSGLQPGETVVTDGQLRVVPGGPVDVKQSHGGPSRAGAAARGGAEGNRPEKPATANKEKAS